MKKIIFPLLFILCTTLNAQNYETRLFGFELLQYREALKNTLGEPFIINAYDDGYEYEIYLLKPDTSLLLIAEFSPKHLNLIWSLQLMSYNSDTLSGMTDGLRLGMEKDSIKTWFGEADKKTDVGEYGERWNYINRNYSFEFSKRNTLSSIKMWDVSFSTVSNPDLELIPTFSTVIEKLNSEDRSEIASILAPDVEIYLGDKIYFYSKSIASEIQNDDSGVFTLIADLAADLKSINTENEDEYSETMRIHIGMGMMHVIKIDGDHKIKEIVMRYQYGEFLIWEVKTGK